MKVRDVEFDGNGAKAGFLRNSFRGRFASLFCPPVHVNQNNNQGLPKGPARSKVYPMRNGKIARLPHPIRNELNFRMDNGEDGAELLKWLNELPEVKSILESGFDGVPISKQNLSEWRKGGFPEWQRHREWIHQACDLHQCTEDMENVLTPPLLAGDLAALLAVRYAALLQSWDGEPDPQFERNLRLLRSMGQDVALLQRTLQRADRQSVENSQRFEDDMEKHSAKMKQLALSPIKAELERGSLRRMFGLFYEDEAAKRLADLVISVKFDLPRRKKFTGEGSIPMESGPVPAGDSLAGTGDDACGALPSAAKDDSARPAPSAAGPVARQDGSRFHRDPTRAQGNIHTPGNMRAEATDKPSGQSQSKPVKPEKAV
jgi:hypothetical protein